MATRRAPGGQRFDHGAQYFTVRDERFERYVAEWMRAGIAAEWRGRIVTLTNGHIEPKESSTPRFVAVPGMNAICKHLAHELDIALETRVAVLERRAETWRLQQEDGRWLGEYDWVLASAPAAQSAELLAGVPSVHKKAAATTMSGCWAAMLTFDDSLDLPFDGAFVHDSILSWVARNDTKPGRVGHSAGPPDRESCWVLHASASWTDRYLNEAAPDILPRLIDAFWRATGSQRRAPTFATAHRWRYAIPQEPLDDRCLFDAEMRAGACGDWCGGPRIEGAFLSGLAMAERLIAQLTSRGD